jgi:hypothetical protein
MKFFLVFFSCILLCQLVSGQSNKSVSGVVQEGGTPNKIAFVSVSVLNAKDSTLVTFTHTNFEGAFSVKNLKYGEYILLVSFPDLADYIERFRLDTVNPGKSFGLINMELKSKVLSEVIVKAKRISMRVKGDTTEFDAGYFKIRPNAKVEDLLRQLPGVEIDNTGKITAQGKTVNKVLVDGEEFFGDDPTLVTKNVRADMIDKVQVYDKKSDKSVFTGIDDGNRNKTINLKLRADKKNGYFGKLEGGLGTNDFYQTQGMFNAFRDNEKLSIYATRSNTGKIGLGFIDNRKYAGDLGAIDLIDGGIPSVFSGKNDDLDSFDGRYNGEGIPKAWNAGIHYDVKWNNNKETLNTNYKVGTINNDGEKNSLTQSNLPLSLIRTSDAQAFSNRFFRQKTDLAYQNQIDSTSMIKFILDAYDKNSDTRNIFLSSSRRFNDTLLNTNSRDIQNHMESRGIHASGFWGKKFRLPGRTLTIAFDENYQIQNTDGYLNSKIHFYNDVGELDSIQLIDQKKVNHLKAQTLKGSAQYTEPLAPWLSLSTNYVFALNNSSSDRRSYNSGSEGYTLLDTLYSSDYSLKQYYNQGGILFNYHKRTSSFNLGVNIAAVNYRQRDRYTMNRFNRNFVNWNPQAIYNVQLPNHRRFSFIYTGNTNQPSIDQLQPIRVNADPLNIFIGNPALKPSFSNAFRLYYEAYNTSSGHLISFEGTYGLITNPIVNNTSIDSTGKNTLQSINLNKQAINYSGEIYNSWKLPKNALNLGLSLRVRGNKLYNLVNERLNAAETGSFGLSFSASKFKNKTYDFHISAGPSYVVNKSSLQDINGNGWNFRGNGGANVYLPGKLKLSADGDYIFSGKTESFNYDFKRFILNAALAKSLSKNEEFNIILQGADLLNENKGFSRYTTENRLTETTYTTIRRYFLLSITWDFSKMSKPSKTDKP